MEHDTLLDKLKWYLANEPVRLVEDFRVLLFVVPVILGVTVDNEVLTAVSTLFSIVISWVGSKKVRDRVTPMHKVETQLQYNPEFKEMVENYG